ncbi:MAG: TorF family putative porin [Pseudomonadota bacterium]
MKYWLLAILSALIAANARAEQQEVPAWGVLLPAISLSSDYRFNGMSLSDRKPALQGSLHLWRPDGYYAGLWVSQVDFLDGETSLELDSYVGRDFAHGKIESKIELMYMAFNDDNVPGPTYDFFQVKTAVKRAFGDTALRATALWSPSGSAGAGQVTQLRVDVEQRVSGFLKLSGLVGRRWTDKAIDRSYWDIGLTLEWKTWDFDIRYYDTNLDAAQCFYTDWCEGGVAAKLTLASY